MPMTLRTWYEYVGSLTRPVTHCTRNRFAPALGAKRPCLPWKGVAERSESFKIMIAGGNHSKIRKLDFLAIGTSEPIVKKD